MSYLLFPFIILQTCRAAFQFMQNESAISPTIIAGNSFAACNYLDYPLLITAFSQRKVYHTHLTHSLRKQDGERRGGWRIVVGAAAIICHWREIENNTASDHGDLLSRWPKNPILNTILLSAILSAVIIHSTAVSMCRLRPAETFISSQEKTIWALASLSNPSSASVAFCRWQSVWRVALKANKCLTLQCSFSQQWLLQATFCCQPIFFSYSVISDSRERTWIQHEYQYTLAFVWNHNEGWAKGYDNADL